MVLEIRKTICRENFVDIREVVTMGVHYISKLRFPSGELWS